MSNIHMDTKITEGEELSRITISRPDGKGSIHCMVAKRNDRYYFSFHRVGDFSKRFNFKQAGSDLIVLLEGTGPVLQSFVIPNYYLVRKTSASSNQCNQCNHVAFSFIAAEEIAEDTLMYVNHEEVTQTPRPTLFGTGPATMLISIYDKTELIGTTRVNAEGMWRFTPEIDLEKRVYSFTARILMPQGDVIIEDIFKLCVGPEFSKQPVIIHTVENLLTEKDNDTSEPNNKTFQSVLIGTAEPKSLINVYLRQKGQEWVSTPDSVRVNISGVWKWTSPSLSKDFSWEFRASDSESDIVPVL